METPFGIAKAHPELVAYVGLTREIFLDIGCRDGLFSFEAEKLRAAEVIAINNDLSSALTQFLIPYFNSKIKAHRLNIIEFSPETFG